MLFSETGKGLPITLKKNGGLTKMLYSCRKKTACLLIDKLFDEILIIFIQICHNLFLTNSFLRRNHEDDDCLLSKCLTSECASII
jgi:hypothetical protein